MKYDDDERLYRSRQTQRIIFFSVAIIVTFAALGTTMVMFEQIRSREEAQRTMTNELLVSVAADYGRALYMVDELVECRCGGEDCNDERARADLAVEEVLANQFVRVLEITSITGSRSFASDYQSVVGRLSELRDGIKQTGGRSSCDLEKEMVSDLTLTVTEQFTLFAN